MATQKELAEQLKLVLAQQKKTAAEIAAVQDSVNLQTIKIADLEAVIANGGAASQELIDAVQAVKEQSQITDDLIPDVAVPTDTPAVPPS